MDIKENPSVFLERETYKINSNNCEKEDMFSNLDVDELILGIAWLVDVNNILNSHRNWDLDVLSVALEADEKIIQGGFDKTSHEKD